MTFLAGLFLFVLCLIVLKSLFWWCAPPTFWQSLGNRIEQIVDSRKTQLDNDVTRLSKEQL